MESIIVEKDFFLGDDYWQYKAEVMLQHGEVYDTSIIWAKGTSQDDISLELNEVIEDHIKYKAEVYANEQLSDIFSYHNSCKEIFREEY